VRLDLSLGYWGTAAPPSWLELVREAERLGFGVVWAAEAYGSDAVSVLTWTAAHTDRIGVGSAVLQIPARTPALTAMTAATLDALSDGRFRLGLGVSGPQVSEGWHGVAFDPPLARTREYVDVVRLALSRQPVEYAGRHYQLPLPGGQGKALKLTVRPVRDHIPLYLAAVGPRNLELAGEIADGLLAVFYAPEHAATDHERLTAGRQRASRTGAHFDVVPTVPIVVGADIPATAEPLRRYAALYLGGMGSQGRNFYNALAGRRGFGDAARVVQERYLGGELAAAAAAVPQRFLDETALLGGRARIADRMQAYAESGVTSLALSPLAGTLPERIAAIRVAAEALDIAGVAE